MRYIPSILLIILFFTAGIYYGGRNPAIAQNESGTSGGIETEGSDTQSLDYAKHEKPKAPKTKLEEFLSKKGSLIITDRYRIGRIGSVDFDAIVLYLPGKEDEAVKGLRVKVDEGSGYSYDVQFAFLDLDEIESLSDALAYLLNLARAWQDTSREYTEAVYKTSDDFRIGFIQEGKKHRTYISCGEITPAYFYFKYVQDLGAVKDLVDKSLKLLNEK